MLKNNLINLRKKQPLIHCITNYVTANDCANILLAIGSSAIMADSAEETEEITALCDGLLLNTGVLNAKKLEAMLKSGIKANSLQHPVILDPVGAGASEFRTKSIQKLLNNIEFDVIRGNLSEIKALFCHESHTHGVDAGNSDNITPENLLAVAELLKSIAIQQNIILAVTGQIDIIADKNQVYCVSNGNPMMRLVTGSGCQLSALTTAFVTANPDNILQAVVTAFCTMGICGEIAFANLQTHEGNASYRNKIIDAVFHLDSELLEEHAKFYKIQ
ncbi:MAG: hydroxyethylthiazole kinase [Oscillospiraceae bacterium]|nr:hydroxyethylthiazole kinase [Oscillospiraceae bacterium]